MGGGTTRGAAGRGWFVPEQRVQRLIARAGSLDRRGWLGRRAAHLVRYRLARTWGVYVHPRAAVGNARFPHPTAIIIGAGSVVEDGAIIYQQVTIGAKDTSERAYPVIRAGAKVYAGAIVIGAVEVGEGATVAANSVVVRDVAPGTTVAGSPARPI